jgi:hypothetical protein
VTRQKVTIDGKALPPGAMLVDGKVVPIPPQAKSGAETRAQMDRVNARRDIDHKIMTQPAGKNMPQPSTPMTTYGDSGFYWQGGKGREW